MKFSQRIGKVPLTKEIQLESIDIDLKNGLWNGISLYVIDIFFNSSRSENLVKFDQFCINLWHDYFKLPVDNIPYRKEDSVYFIREKFYNSSWYEVYDLLEFLAQLDFRYFGLSKEGFVGFCNNVLEREFSGYRFINNLISPITNQQEINGLETAIENTSQFTSLKGANIHLRKALDKLSDRKNPDYRNSIKESISAVESLAKVIAGNGKDSLGAAIDKIKGKITIHPALEKGLKNLYGYTSDGDGIRHALMDAPTCDFEDAKFMLVSCSSFINYLIVKADKAGIKLDS